VAPSGLDCGGFSSDDWVPESLGKRQRADARAKKAAARERRRAARSRRREDRGIPRRLKRQGGGLAQNGTPFASRTVVLGQLRFVVTTLPPRLQGDHPRSPFDETAGVCGPQIGCVPSNLAEQIR